MGGDTGRTCEDGRLEQLNELVNLNEQADGDFEVGTEKCSESA